MFAYSTALNYSVLWLCYFLPAYTVLCFLDVCIPQFLGFPQYETLIVSEYNRNRLVNRVDRPYCRGVRIIEVMFREASRTQPNIMPFYILDTA